MVKEQKSRKPRLVLLMGANGAGKSRWTREHRTELPEHFFNREATTDRLGLCPNVAAARARCLASGTSFGIETTFTRAWRRSLLRDAAAGGFLVDAILIGTEKASINIQRVRERAKRNEGHLVPRGTVRRRWSRVQENLITERAAFRSIRIIDSTNDPPIETARIDDERRRILIENPAAWISALIGKF